MPKVSVIVPCFNLGEYLAEAVDSALAQTCLDLEVIVVDDGSTEPRTRALLDVFRRPRTTVLRTPNRGLAAARNHAIRHSSGKYVCALDADDRLHPTFLEKTTALLDADPSLAFASTWLQAFGSESFLWKPERCDFPRLLAECVVLTAAPVRREALEAVGGYDEQRFGEGDEDWDLWIGLVERGLRGAIVPEVLFDYRQRPGSMRRLCTRGETRLRLFGNLLEKHRQSYLRWLPEVLLLKEEECGRLLRDNFELERELTA
jgi:glycosyltransferase involved in cell wall biosynthesis